MMMNKLILVSVLLGLVLPGSLVRAQSDSTVFDAKIAELMEQVSKDSLAKYIQDLADAGGHKSRASYTEGNLWAVQYIKERFESFAGLTSVELDTFLLSNAQAPYDTVPLFNVVATLEGQEHPGQIYVVGGHLDATANRDGNINWDNDWPTAMAPGADDNATGVASILEIARILSDPANDINQSVTIKFVAFGAEEVHPAYSSSSSDHHFGSLNFVKEAYQNGDDILGAYIMDMIGYNNTGNDYFDVVSNAKSISLGEDLLETNSVYEVGLESNEPPFENALYSDHDKFWNYRYLAILLIEHAPPWEDDLPWYTINPYYHKESDTFEHVNLNQVHKIAQLTLGTLASLSTVTSVETVPGERPDVPESFELLQNYPNPFNAGTLIRYRLATAAPVRLTIYNLRGQKVASLVEGLQTAGTHAVLWDGKNAAHQELSSAIYLYELQVGERRQIRKMVLSK